MPHILLDYANNLFWDDHQLCDIEVRVIGLVPLAFTLDAVTSRGQDWIEDELGNKGLGLNVNRIVILERDYLTTAMRAVSDGLIVRQLWHLSPLKRTR